MLLISIDPPVLLLHLGRDGQALEGGGDVTGAYYYYTYGNA